VYAGLAQLSVDAPVGAATSQRKEV
jgi:hypothetical protein